MGLPPMFARPEARHQRQIASTGPAWGQWTDMLIVATGMVLTARYVALFFSFCFHWSILFLLSFLLPILAVSGMPPVITLLFICYLPLRSLSIYLLVCYSSVAFDPWCLILG